MLRRVCALDVDAAALDATHVAPGVTNVDVNPPRQALAGLWASEPLHLNVGSDALRVSTGAGEIVEGAAAHPLAQGFAETQMLSAGMACRHALTGGPCASSCRRCRGHRRPRP